MIGAIAGLMSTSEIRRLIARLILTEPIATAFIWAWSLWRRQHQKQAAISHRKRRRKRKTIAVGTLIIERPPHRSVRAEFPHTAPTSGI